MTPIRYNNDNLTINKDIKINDHTFREESDSINNIKSPKFKQLSQTEENKYSNINNLKDVHDNSIKETQILKQEIDKLNIKIEKLIEVIEEEKRKSNINLHDENNKIILLKKDHEEYVQDIKKKHKIEINEIEERFKTYIKSLNEEKQIIKTNYEQELLSEKDRLKLIHSSELENMENNYKRNIEDLKKLYEKQNDTLNLRLKQQIEKEERIKVDKEIIRLNEIQETLKEMEFNAKEKNEKERLELMRKINNTEAELEKYKSEYKSKNNELEYEKRKFYDEKEFFEKFKNEELK